MSEWEGGRHAVSKFRRADRVKVTTEDRKRGNLAAEFKREKIVNERRRTDEMKSLCPGELCAGSPTHAMRTSNEGGQGPYIWTLTVWG